MPIQKELTTPAKDYTSLLKKQLLNTHAILHALYKKLAAGKKLRWRKDIILNSFKVKKGDEMTKKHIVHLYKQIIKKMHELNYEVNTDKPLGKTLPESLRTFNEFTFFIDKLQGFRLKFLYVRAVGGVCNWGTSEGDVDVLIKDIEGVNFYDIVTDALSKRWSDIPTHFFGDNFLGPFTCFLPLYNLNVKRVSSGPKKCEPCRGELAPVFPSTVVPKERITLPDFIETVGDENVDLNIFAYANVESNRDNLNILKVYVPLETVTVHFITPFKFRIYRQLPHHLWPRVQVVCAEPPEGAKLIFQFYLERVNKENHVIQMSANVTEFDLSRTVTTKEQVKQAEWCKTNDKLRLFWFFYRRHSELAFIGVQKSRKWSSEDFWNFLDEFAKKKGLEWS